MPVPRSGDTEGVGIGNRFTQEVDQRVMDARVLDARRGEKILHDAAPCRFHGEPKGSARPSL